MASSKRYDSERKIKLVALRNALIKGEENGSAGALNMEDIKKKARLRADA